MDYQQEKLLTSVEKNLKDRIEKLESRFNGMQNYLNLKFDEEDWHAVMDASADIREILAELKILREWYDSVCGRQT